MRVAMWTSWETRCGIAEYARSLVEALRGLGAEVAVVPVPYTDRDRARAAAILSALHAADVVHLQHEYTFFGGVAPGASSLPRYLRALKRPLVVTAHTVFTAAELLRLPQEHRPRQRLAKRLLAAYPPYRAAVERAPFRSARGLIVHTEAARQRMLARGIAPERIRVLPAGLPEPAETSPAALASEIERLRARCGAVLRGEGARVVTIFGFVTPDKGYETALGALAALPPAVRLLVAGGTRVEHEAPYMERLQATIRARGLDSRVAITGFLEEREVSAAMALSDLVLVPHTAANGSYSVMIALAHGKPVLASDLACFRELRETAGCLELFPAGEERALAERLGFLLASAGARRRLAEAAQRFARERTWTAVARQTLDLYGAAAGATDTLRGPRA